MSAYLNNSIDSENYQKHRIRYPKSLYEGILEYHKGGRNLAVDVGCGTGIGTFPLLDYFQRVVGCDPSSKMLKTSILLTERLPEDIKQKIKFTKTGGENLSEYFEDSSVDLIVAGESIQYTKLDLFFDQAHKVLKPGGTLSYWFYCDPILVDYPKANEIFKKYVYEDEQNFGFLWPPEMSCVRRLGATIKIPADKFGDVQCEEYIPLKTAQPGRFFVHREDYTLRDLRNNMSTWGVYQTWLDNHKDETLDIVDVVIDKIKSECNISEDTFLSVQWETAFYMARNIK